ncbi:MAG: SsrA-binding protein SmpB [Chthonomonadales bacterium]|nr:SsrA-binding protein SmpB [Chthonomonadales bacterium]
MKKPKAEEKGRDARRIVLQNRRARHEYAISETFEAGIVLSGCEVKSIRQSAANISDAFVKVENGEVWVHNMHVAPYEQGVRFNPDPRRPRKLLLHRREIDRVRSQIERKGYAVVPLSLYFRNGYAKLELGLGHGKKQFDKREAIARRDTEREAERELRSRDRKPSSADE